MGGPADHPRSRGVYGPTALGEKVSVGSSPLARGLLPTGQFLIQHGGIIPARAGFTLQGRCDVFGGSDHPRSRGVYCPLMRIGPGPMGSSPLARGLPPGHLERTHHVGIIPARAGFTVAVLGDFRGETDHPRSRGVYK